MFIVVIAIILINSIILALILSISWYWNSTFSGGWYPKGGGMGPFSCRCLWPLSQASIFYMENTSVSADFPGLES